MAGAPVIESHVVGTELERVLPKVTVVFESDRRFYNSIKKRNVEVVSYREMRVPQELRPGGAFQYFNPDGGDLGRGGGPYWDVARLRPVFVSQNIEYTKLSQWATDDSRKAVQNAVRRMTVGALTELQRQIDAQLMGAGNGIIGVATATGAVTGGTSYTLAAGHRARLVRYGQTVQVYATNQTTFLGKGIITFWDVSNGIVHVSPAIPGAGSTDILVVDGISAPGTALTNGEALYGVKYHHSAADSGLWLGYNRANFPEIRSNEVNAGSSALTLAMPRLAINKIGNRVGIDDRFSVVAWMHPAQQQAYEDIGQLVSIIHKQPKDEGLNLYFGDNMQMAGAPVRAHFNWDTRRIDFVNDAVWGRGEILPIGFYTSDGRRIFELRGPSGGVMASDIFYMVNGFQTFLTNPAATAYIAELAVPSGY